MDSRIREALAALPRLDVANAHAGGTSCKVCGAAAEFFDVCDFNKCTDGYVFGPSGVYVNWYNCTTCSFIFTDFFDRWTAEDFGRFVYNEDYVKVDGEYLGARPKRTAAAAAELLRGHEARRILDYGSGLGLFAQRMAEQGFPAVENYDPIASPMRPVGQFDIITCFEVMEHSPDPIGTLRDMASLLTPGGVVMVGTLLQPPEIASVRTNWWYAAPRNGHLSLYSDHALAVAAGRARLRFHPGERHLLTSDGVGPLAELVERRNGPPVFFTNLGAPPTGDHPSWHAIERQSRGSFRWTAATRITWSVDLPAGSWRVQIRIPVWGQATTGSGRIAMNGKNVVVRKDDIAYIADSETAATGRMTIVLETPELRSPHERTGSPDKRQLGLAIPVIDHAGLMPTGCRS